MEDKGKAGGEPLRPERPRGGADVFAGAGEMAARCREIDWAATPLGPVEGWPDALRFAVRTCLESPFPINLWCGPELVLVYNDGYRHVLGPRHPAALGRPGPEVWAEIWPEIEPMFQDIRAGGPPVYADDAPFVVERPAGHPAADPAGGPNAWYTFALSPVRDEQGDVVAFLNIVSETTGRILAERATDSARAAAQAAEARLRDVFAQAPSFMAVLRGPEHVFEFVNEAYYTLVGRRELLGRPVVDALPEVRGQGFDRLLDRVLATGEPFVGAEVRFLLQPTPDAEPEERFLDFVYYPITEADGTRSGVVAHGSDVTGSVLARREVETQRARLEQIFTEAPAVMALYSGPDHVVTLVNPTWERSVGKPGAVGKPFREVFPEFAGTGLFEMLDRVYRTGEPFVDPEVNVPLERWGSGVLEDTWWHLVWRPLSGPDPERRDILVHAVEVTAQVRARREVEQKAEELARLAAALELSNRELDQFAYVASHDLRTPLRGISNLSQWIEDDLDDRFTDSAREHMRLLRTRVERLDGLIDGILRYSRAGRVGERPERVDVGALVHEVVDLLAPPPEVEVRVLPGFPVLLTERLPLQQVLLNLVGNAVKYRRGEAPWVEVAAERRDAGWEFRVSDNGRGIAPEYHERIFGIFQTLHARDEVEGTGIGLSIVKKAVESRGGRVSVESGDGQGATFRFLWPAAEA